MFEQISVAFELVSRPPPPPSAAAAVAALAAQAGNLFRSNMATPYVLIQITNTVTARIFIPNPALAWKTVIAVVTNVGEALKKLN